MTDQFIDDVADLHAVASLAPHDRDWDEIEAILIDLVSDLAKSPECRACTASSESDLWAALDLIRDDTGAPASVHLLVLRVVRNACVENPAAQARALDHGWAAHLLAKLDEVVREQRQGIDAKESGPTAVEVIVNLVADNAEAARRLLAVGDDRAGWLLALLSASDEAIVKKALVLVLVLVVTHALPFIEADATCAGARVLERMFLVAAAKPGIAIDDDVQPDAQSPYPDNDADHAPASPYLSYVFAIVRALVMDPPHFIAVYRCVAPLPTVQAALLDHVLLVAQECTPPTSPFPPAVLDFLIAEFARHVATIAATDDSADSDGDAINNSIPVPVLLAQLHVLEYLTLHHQPMPLLDAVVTLLGHLHTHQPRTTLRDRSPNEITTPAAAAAAAGDAGPLHGIFHTKKTLLLTLAQLVYGNRAMQDRVRELDAVALVLAQCNYDDRHPYLREYGVYALRNVLEGNEANQAVVDGLRAIDLAPGVTDALKDMNVDPEKVRAQVMRKQG
ncbi:Ataxin-10 [Allomyces javanicus]|nr:Ataxin-10 [Allomyces javanicus]